jgi:Molybdopterin-binding domain of aldehyde dehydrogenase
MDRALLHTDNGYRLGKAVSLRGHLCKTNQASNTAFRGFGGPQGAVTPPNPFRCHAPVSAACAALLTCRGPPWHTECSLSTGKTNPCCALLRGLAQPAVGLRCITSSQICADNGAWVVQACW